MESRKHENSYMALEKFQNVPFTAVNEKENYEPTGPMLGASQMPVLFILALII